MTIHPVRHSALRGGIFIFIQQDLDEAVAAGAIDAADQPGGLADGLTDTSDRTQQDQAADRDEDVLRAPGAALGRARLPHALQGKLPLLDRPLILQPAA